MGVGRRTVVQTMSGERERGTGTGGDGKLRPPLLSADINFSVSGLFSALTPQDKVSDRPASEELPTSAVATLAAAPAPAPAPASVLASAPAPASVATKER